MEHDRPASQTFWWQGWIPADSTLPTVTVAASSYATINGLLQAFGLGVASPESTEPPASDCET